MRDILSMLEATTAEQVTTGGLPWTGERYLPSVSGIIQLEHIHRYLMAKQLARDRDVLDIASGEGYGSAMLAKVARHVIGVDNSESVIVHARKTYIEDNLEYRLGSCESIPLADSSIDLVVSFETIEHHDQHQAMMREIRRVLRPGGVLMISSPDKYEYSVVTQYRNPYHVKELYREEFETLLSDYFRNITYLGQRVVYGSAIFQKQRPAAIVSFRREDDRIVCSPGIPRPVYLIAIASDAEPPELSSGFFVQAFDETSAGLDREIDELSTALARVTAERDALAAECVGVSAELAALYHSTSWRITRPLRWVADGWTAPRRSLGRLAHWIYRAMPLPMATKLAVKSRIFKRFGPWLKEFRSYRSWLEMERKQAGEAADRVRDQ